MTAWIAWLLAVSIAPFSAAAPGTSLPAGWTLQVLPKAAAPQVALVPDGAGSVLRIRAANAAGGAVHAVRAALVHPKLAWRWKVDRVVAGADLGTREGDDFAARVYVLFDVPVDKLPFAARWKVRLARFFHGEALPTAALCYVWDNRHAPGTSAWNAYTDRVRTIVVDSGAGSAGRWVDRSRDVEADFRAAFGAQWSGALPAIAAVAVAADTDQTHEVVTAWFGDVTLEDAP